MYFLWLRTVLLSVVILIDNYAISVHCRDCTEVCISDIDFLSFFVYKDGGCCKGL